MNREEKLELYQKAVGAHPEITIKGKKSTYTSVNGHMFLFLSGDAIMAIRLSKEGQKLFIENHDSGSGDSIQFGNEKLRKVFPMMCFRILK